MKCALAIYIRPETRRFSREQAENILKKYWRAEPVFVA